MSRPRAGALLGCASILLALLATAAGAGASTGAHAAGRAKRHPRRAPAPTCSGSAKRPGVLTGRYRGNVSVGGYCLIDHGSVQVGGDLTVLAGATLLADYGLDDRTHTGESNLTVAHNLIVQKGATALLGCEPEQFTCVDDPNPNPGTLSSTLSVGGGVSEHEPLGVVIHHADIAGSLAQTGGGGGMRCDSLGAFTTVHFPVYSDYEDNDIGGSLTISGLRSCWLGIARVQVGGNVSIVDDQLADPDAIEILSNTITGNLTCEGDSDTWDSKDATEELWPREAHPNQVTGMRSGQCLLASPATEGAPFGPGPF